MAHKTLINGTAYEIDGGKAMVDGTVYEIDKGKTLVDGTAYEVGFAPDVVTVYINGAGLSNRCYISIDGVEYISATSITVPGGTEIYCRVYSGTGSNGEYSYIYVNGNEVAESGATYGEYTYIVNSDVIVDMNNGAGGHYGSTIEITEVPEDHVMVNIAGTGYYNGCYVTINGKNYSSKRFVAISNGTEVYCFAKSYDGENSNYYGIISLNGTRVATADKYFSGKDEYWYAEYNYTVNGNVMIYLSGGSSSSGGGVISIAEQ